MRILIVPALLALAACNSDPAPEAVQVDPAARALTDACLADQGLPPLPPLVTDQSSLSLLDQAQLAALEACIRAGGPA